jgi:hypothetical protein
MSFQHASGDSLPSRFFGYGIHASSRRTAMRDTEAYGHGRERSAVANKNTLEEKKTVYSYILARHFNGRKENNTYKEPCY